MASVEGFLKFEPRDFPDAPEWFHHYLEHMNNILEPVISAFQSDLTTANQNAEVVDMYAPNAEQFTLEAPDVKGEIEEVRHVWAERNVTALAWERSASGALVTIAFSGSPIGTTRVKLKVVGGE